MNCIDSRYLEQVADAVVEVVVAAAADSRPGRLYYARPPVQIGRNRRPQSVKGEVVPYAHVLSFAAECGVEATLFSYACHPVVLGRDNHQISADFPGPRLATLRLRPVG